MSASFTSALNVVWAPFVTRGLLGAALLLAMGCGSDAPAPPDACVPSPEQCDDVDHDCDGDPMNGFDLRSDPANCDACGHACELPGATGTCNDGACVFACLADRQDIDQDLDDPTSNGCEYSCPVHPRLSEERCNGDDDDCDGSVDELPIARLGDACYPDALVGCEVGVGCAGVCGLGELRCNDGTEICAGFTGPEPIEQCDDIDHDCDGDPRNGVDTANDPSHCGAQCVVCDLLNAENGCRDVGAGGECYALSCLDGWENADGDDESTDVLGCEYECTKTGDELCDGVDNDCDLLIDESFPQVAHAPTEAGDPCDNGESGICRGTGIWICDATDPSRAVCDITAAGQTALTYELCNNLDDNCNGLVDELEGPAGVLIMTDTWVLVPAGTTSSGAFVSAFLMDAYEASRPDADATDEGSAEHLACSNSGAMPWRSVHHAAAEAACLAAGKRLCTQHEWQRACEGAGPFGVGYSSYPYGVAYDADACNGGDYDVDCTAPNDHFLPYPAGNEYGCPRTLDTCVSAFGVHDLSGNVQEWTASIIATGPDYYAVRGGGYESAQGELTCQSASTAFDDTMSLPTLGFRCCRDVP